MVSERFYNRVNERCICIIKASGFKSWDITPAVTRRLIIHFHQSPQPLDKIEGTAIWLEECKPDISIAHITDPYALVDDEIVH